MKQRNQVGDTTMTNEQAIEQIEGYTLRETVGKVDSLIGDAFQKIKEIFC